MLGIVNSGFKQVNLSLSYLIVDWRADVSVRLQPKIFSRLLFGFSEIDGVRLPSREKQNLTTALPLCRIRDLDSVSEVLSHPVGSSLSCLDQLYSQKGNRMVPQVFISFLT